MPWLTRMQAGWEVFVLIGQIRPVGCFFFALLLYRFKGVCKSSLNSDNFLAPINYSFEIGGKSSRTAGLLTVARPCFGVPLQCASKEAQVRVGKGVNRGV